MIWFTADTHFGHWNVCKYCDRPFQSIEEHDQTLRDNWNSVVKPSDIVYHLGDLAWLRGRIKSQRLAEIINSLNGRKYLILGNHDREKHIRKYNIDITILGHYHELTIQDEEIGKAFVVLCHYPFRSWNRSFHGSISLHGHTHNTVSNEGLARLDVGVDAHNYRPISWEDVKVIMTKRLLKKGM